MQISRRRFLAASAAPIALRAQAVKPRLARKDCFLGMHFDLHPNARDTALGRDVTEPMIQTFLDKVKPDYVQYDSKGHAGYLGFPSKVGTSAPGIVNDSLAVWRKVTARNSVALFIHFSGVWDSLAVQQRPEWARVGPDGKPDERQTSLFGPYADELMIPQLREAAEKYDLDGAWVDGECWATNPDYSDAAAKAFKEATGIDTLPRSAKDKGWLEFLEFNRAQFRKYVRHYIDTLHATHPKFQIASNWLYSTYVPERPDLPVDFISGDYLGNAALSSARLEARYMAQTGKPWDLMAWGFQRGSGSSGPIHKPATQLQQEAAVVLAQGGGFQIYYQPTRAGKLDDRHIGVMSRVAKFCRDRQEASHKSESVPQAGVVFSTTSLYTTTGKLFGGWGAAVNPARGIIDGLVESHYSVDVVPEWKLETMARSYPLIVVPDWPNLGEKVRDALAAYARRGGRLLIAGAENAALFRDELGVQLTGEPSEQPAWIPGTEVFANLRGRWQDLEPQAAQSIEQRFPAYDSTRDAKCAATLHKTGSGLIAAVYGPLGATLAATHAAEARNLLQRIVARMFTPMAEIDGPPTVEVALRTKNGKLLLHLLNNTAMQVAGDYATTDFVPALGPLTLKLRLPKAPRRVALIPGGRPLPGQYVKGVWTARIDSLHLHSIVSVEA